LVLSAGGDLDAAIPAAAALRLLRSRGELYAVVDDTHARSFRRALAYCGIRALPVADLPRVDPRAIPARSDALVPLPDDVGAIDVVTVEVVPLAAATRRETRRRVRWLPLDPRRRARCRALLRGEEHLLAWERRAWIGRSDLSDARVRRILRPIVFDRRAIAVTRLAHVCYRTDRAFAQWTTV
jgi:hypothetical protein